MVGGIANRGPSATGPFELRRKKPPVVVFQWLQRRLSSTSPGAKNESRRIRSIDPPHHAEFEEPVAHGPLTVVDVRASALTHLDVAIATGKHYLSPQTGSAVVGREAVVTGPSGERLFLNARAIASPFGSMAQRTLANLDMAIAVPGGVSDELAATIGNAGLAAWLPLAWLGALKRGEKVLVLGATGTSGRIAVAAARLLGAGRVVATGRDPKVLHDLQRTGADAVVALTDGLDLRAAFLEAGQGEFDVVVDYLNGAPSEAALGAMANGGRMVQVGSLLAPGIMLNAQVMRSANLDVRGFAYYHAPMAQQAAAYRELCSAALAGAFEIDITALPLTGFSTAWDGLRKGDKTRYVLQAA